MSVFAKRENDLLYQAMIQEVITPCITQEPIQYKNQSGVAVFGNSLKHYTGTRN